jgi:AraC-like DNA-binding protein
MNSSWLQCTTPAQSIGNIVAVATPRIATRTLLKTVGLGPASLNNRLGRIPYSQLVTLYEEAARLAGDDAFGLHVGERIELRTFGLFGYLIVNCPTLGEAWQAVARYLPLWTDGAALGVDVDRTSVRLVWEYADASMTDCRQDCEMSLAAVARIGRFFSAVECKPREVHFRHRQPRNTSEHRRIFGSAPCFDMPVDEIILESKMLEIPIRGADYELHELLKTHLDGLLSQVAQERSYTGRVRRSIRMTIQSQSPTLETTSKHIGVSTRTLQRRLRDEGTSHGWLLDEVRRESADRYLRDPRTSIQEIAYRLGFSESSAFHRAFRKWQGSTPGERRRQMA